MDGKIREFVAKLVDVYNFSIFVCKKQMVMRTNIDIDDQLLSQVMAFSGAKTKKEAINEALKYYLYRVALKKLEEMRGPGAWEGNLDEMRTVER
jgi:Arc/MetJ family transcription regulator